MTGVLNQVRSLPPPFDEAERLRSENARLLREKEKYLTDNAYLRLRVNDLKDEIAELRQGHK